MVFIVQLCMLYSEDYIYYKEINTQICFIEAEINLEFNRSMSIITAVQLFKTSHCHSNSWIVSSENSQEGPHYPMGPELDMSTLHSQYGFCH